MNEYSQDKSEAKADSELNDEASKRADESVNDDDI